MISAAINLHFFVRGFPIAISERWTEATLKKSLATTDRWMYHPNLAPHTHTHIYIYKYMVCVYILCVHYVYIYIYTCTYIDLCMYIYIYIYTYTHTYIFIDTMIILLLNINTSNNNNSSMMCVSYVCLPNPSFRSPRQKKKEGATPGEDRSFAFCAMGFRISM